MQQPRVETYGKVDLVLNNDLKQPGKPHVRGVGKIPLDFSITESGSLVGRKLKVYVVVHERLNPNSDKPGKFVKDYCDPRTITAERAGEVKSSFKASIPVNPGDYIFYVYLCDPDKRYLDRGVPIPQVDKDKIPGRERRMQACVASVE